MAFTNGLRLGKFLFSVYKNYQKTMINMLYWAIKYMNAKDAIIAREDRLKKREKHDNPRPDKVRKATRIGDRRDERRSSPPYPKVNDQLHSS